MYYLVTACIVAGVKYGSGQNEFYQYLHGFSIYFWAVVVQLVLFWCECVKYSNNTILEASSTLTNE